MLGVIGGSSFLESKAFQGLSDKSVPTPFGVVALKVDESRRLVFVQRHVADPLRAYSLPHLINFRAIMTALKHLGVERIVAFGSVGSLRPEIHVSSVLVPNDFYCPWDAPFFNESHAAHTVPGFDGALRTELLSLVSSIKDLKVIDGGVYAQTKGPRFETPVEVKALALVGGSVVGMTCAHEAVLAKEIGIPYALVCIVDNMGNGIIATDELSYGSFKESVKGHLPIVELLASAVVSKFCPLVSSGTLVDLIVEPKYLLPVIPHGVQQNKAVIVHEGIIIDILDVEEAKKKYNARELIRLADHVLMPGLINAHTHMGMTHLRGFADDLALFEWLSKHIWPAEGRFMSPEFVIAGVELALAEMIRSGTTAMADQYFFPESTASVIDKVGCRGCVGVGVLEFPNPFAKNADEYLSKAKDFALKWSKHDRITASIVPHAPYTVSDATFLKVKALAEEVNVVIQTHLHETSTEKNDSISGAASGSKHLSSEKTSPLVNLHRMGLLNKKTMAVHMTVLDDSEIKIVADTGLHVVHCPVSNLKLAAGICPVAKLVKAGVNVALGTDSASSNNSLNLFEEMKLAAILAKVHSGDPTAVNAMTAIEMATINGARAMSLDHKIGSLEVGKCADFIALNFGDVELTPCYNIPSHIVYCAGRENVSDVWVQGRALLRNRKLQTLDYERVLREAKSWGIKISHEIHHTP